MRTTYSDWFTGTAGNYHRRARFDKTGGFIGITVRADNDPVDRVLLSAAQAQALVEFISPKPLRKRR